MTEPLRFGCLGAARITPNALITPAQAVPGVAVEAVAARSRARAAEYAAQHRIPVVCDDYATLVESADIDCVYNALPASLHCEWTVRALEAGKHVLCEKPMASNAEEAERMARAAEASGTRLVEAAHHLHHPALPRLRELLESRTIGDLESLHSTFCAPIPTADDVRFDYALGGGAMMDLGCYPLSALRFLTRAEPEIESARAEEDPPHIDVDIVSELRFGNLPARIHCSMRADFEMFIEARGKGGRIRATMAFVPHLGGRLEIETPDGKKVEKADPTPTYVFQLRAFEAHVRNGEPTETSAESAIGTMRAIDAIYRAAGLEPRGL